MLDTRFVLRSDPTHSLEHRRLFKVIDAKVGLIEHNVTITGISDTHQLISKAAYGLEPSARPVHAT